jgi:hypothetical protein
MSLIKANAVQIGQSPTATQNFTLAVPSSPDGTIKLARGNAGATTQDVISVDASGNIDGLVKSTGSTTARSLANRFTDVVNVKDFGAVGDGVTDNFPYFTLAKNSGKSIYIPSGTYNFGSSFISSGTSAWIIDPNVQFTGIQPDFERGVWSDHNPNGTIGGNGVNLWRLYDRVLIGDANKGYNGQLNSGNTWTTDYGVGYFQSFSQTASFSSFGGIGIAAASQSIDVPSGNDASIGIGSCGINNNINSKSAWAYYGQAVQVLNSGGTFTSGMELNTCTEKNSDDPNPYNISSGINIPHTHWIGVGGEYPQTVSAICKPISAGIIFASNSYRNAVAGTGNLFRRGIVFQSDSILGTDGNTGKGIAISFAKGHSIEWDFLFSGFTYRGARIRSDVQSISNPTGLVFNNNGVNFVKIDSDVTSSTENKLLRIDPIQNAVNNIVFKASESGNPLEIIAEGSDANIDITIAPKNGGVLKYNLPFNAVGSATISGFMYIKDASGTLRKLAVIS